MNYVATLRDQMHEMGQTFVESLPALGIALFIIFATWISSRFATRISDMLVSRTELRSNLRIVVDALVRWGLWASGLLIAAAVVIPDFTLVGMLIGLGVGVAAIGFAFHGIVENVIAGVFVMKREKMRVGDVLQIDLITGKVEHIGLRETHLRKLSGELIILPNSVLLKNPIQILTDEETRRHEVVVGVSYDANLDHAADVIRRAVESVDDILVSKGVDIFAQEFNSSSVDFLVRWWAGATPRSGWESKDKVIRAIKFALDEAHIAIPFPHMTHTFKETVPVSHLGDTRRKTP